LAKLLLLVSSQEFQNAEGIEGQRESKGDQVITKKTHQENRLFVMRKQIASSEINKALKNSPIGRCCPFESVAGNAGLRTLRGWRCVDPRHGVRLKW
jgi:hypothetical protein